MYDIRVYRCFLPDNPEPHHVFAYNMVDATNLLLTSGQIVASPDVPTISMIEITGRLRQGSMTVAQHTWAMQDKGFTGLATYSLEEGWVPLPPIDEQFPTE